ncbi:hypothetical protein [Microvirga subterranea]|uniref:Uncharacterized protein n=1 Tax=Microvirga subterranea TaxID=186651 RepID=A0A370HGZ1_9HYPH|nr:hypothetical protein [Microvirga subterranea]RDI57158.1 hypothetical protein DES45_10775 [Microvirga subterranea]
MTDRRRFPAVLGGAGAVLSQTPAFAGKGLPKAVMGKDPSRACCSGQALATNVTASYQSCP